MIYLSGGDTVFSNKLSFTIITLGYSKKIILRNNAKINDDIYVTGNLGDSFIGLKVLKKKIILKKNLKSYFIKKYYHPDLYINITKKLLKFANTSIDISDGLISDIDKLINKQNLSYKLYLKDIPISNNLKNVIKLRKIKKLSCISQGDDYQILFTAAPSKSRLIKNVFKNSGIKISKIGKIYNNKKKSQIINEKNVEIRLKNKGYFVNFKKLIVAFYILFLVSVFYLIRKLLINMSSSIDNIYTQLLQVFVNSVWIFYIKNILNSSGNSKMQVHLLFNRC